MSFSFAFWGGGVSLFYGSSDALSIVALDRTSGRVAWILPITDAPREFHRLNSRATPTPAIWRNRVYAYFGSQGLACADTHGKKLWVSENLPFQSSYGVVVSPVICDDRVIVLSESGRKSNLPGFLAALDCDTGRLLWKTARPVPTNFAGNNRTPIVLTRQGRKQLVVVGETDVTAYDPATGQTIWTCKFSSRASDLVGSPVSDGERVYVPLNDEIAAIDLATVAREDPVFSWRRRCPGLNCSSPVVAKELLFAVGNTGITYCLDSKTGEVVWKKALEGTHYCSPVVGGEAIYFCSIEGRTTVFKCGRACEILAVNNLRERTMASFAPVDGRLYVRTHAYLYCIGGRTP